MLCSATIYKASSPCILQVFLYWNLESNLISIFLPSPPLLILSIQLITPSVLNEFFFFYSQFSRLSIAVLPKHCLRKVFTLISSCAYTVNLFFPNKLLLNSTLCEHLIFFSPHMQLLLHPMVLQTCHLSVVTLNLLFH